MIKKYQFIVSFVFLFAISIPSVIYAQDETVKSSSTPPSEELFDSLEKNSENLFKEKESELDSLWAKMEKEEEEKWKRLEKEVLQKWDAYEQTSAKTWVDYSGERDSVSKTDFENGNVVIEAVIPANEPDQNEAAKQIIAKKTEEMVQTLAPDGKPVIQDMLPVETVEAVKEKKIEPIVEKKVITGTDGIKRVKVKIELKMVPGHIKKRAERYIPAVEEEARKRGVEPSLMMAVMHTESAFNPMARSPFPAFGLMQLVPRFAAKEAYKQLYGAEKVLTPDYLYDPKHNIELGATYLARLEQIYFKDVQDPIKRRYIAICAYNWGPTAMKRKIMDKIKIETKNTDELFRMLLAKVPDETKNYLKRVEERRGLYGG